MIEPSYTYSVFGLSLHSNKQIPELSIAERSAVGPAVQIYLNVSPLEAGIFPCDSEVLTYSSPYKDDAGNPALKMWKIGGGDFTRLAYADGTQFWLNHEGTEVWATWPDQSTIEDTATYLLGPILGRLLRLRGITCLHASAVAFGEKAVAFVGSEGAGKSTTAAALALRGHAVLSDDVVALAQRGGSFFVRPAYPYLCLWPESVESIYGSAEALPRFSANYEKRCLSLAKQELQFEERTLQLAAIYILGQRRGDPAPLVQEIAPREALLTLVANTFATNILDPGMRAKEFETLGRLVPSVPIRQLCAHQDPSRLPDLCDLLSEETKKMLLWKPVTV
ncbi:MAG TPA: hypothetical protein VNO32_19165 [Candidatus Acidoferrum sp.]|nr:hypothetical protein [Candidatus Acidoferrum sp.]